MAVMNGASISKLGCLESRLPFRGAICRSSKSPSPTPSNWVFQASPPRGYHHSLLDVRDAVETCSTVRSPEEREQCFLNFGLSSEAVDRYYEPVLKMEEAIEERTSEADAMAQRMVRVAGFLLILMFGCRLV